MKTFKLIPALLVASMLAVSPVWAQMTGGRTDQSDNQKQQTRQTDQSKWTDKRDEQPQARTQTRLQQSGPLMVSDDLVGKDVRNYENKDLGEVHDVVLGQNGQISYIIVSTGGVLGMGETLHPVPANAVTFDRQNKVVLLNMDEQKLAQAPKIEKDDLAGLNNPEFSQQVYSYYGVESQTRQQSDMKQHSDKQGQQQDMR